MSWGTLVSWHFLQPSWEATCPRLSVMGSEDVELARVLWTNTPGLVAVTQQEHSVFIWHCDQGQVWNHRAAVAPPASGKVAQLASGYVFLERQHTGHPCEPSGF